MNRIIKYLPHDIHLNIINCLPFNDAKNFGLVLDKEEIIKEHMLGDEYILSFLKNKEMINIRRIIIGHTIVVYEEILTAFKNQEYKPIRFNTENGTFYSHLNNYNDSVLIKNIKVPTVPESEISFIFKRIFNNQILIYYWGLDVLFIITDNSNINIRNIFIRIPYDSKEFVYGFIANMVRIIAKQVKDTNWTIRCEYMFCTDTKKDPLFVNPIMANYNTRRIDTFRYKFLEKLIGMFLDDIGRVFNVCMWNIYTSPVLKDIAMMKYLDSENIEEVLQLFGFTNNKEIQTNIYLNSVTNRYIVELYDNNLEMTGEN